MDHAQLRAPVPDGEPANSPVRRVLVVEDSAVERRVLRARLERRGYAVSEAADGRAAAALLAREHVPLVLCDWMMPGMDGPALCRWIRRARGGDDRPYTYIILLTGRTGEDSVAEGLEAGADDFLSKPVGAGELNARLKSGWRVVTMQAGLLAERRALARANDALRATQARIERDLLAAAELQRGVIPPAEACCAGLRIAAAYRPAGHVGGDHIGYLAGEAGTVAAFSIDVSGHGVASALETVRLAELLRPGAAVEEGRLALTGADGLRSPGPVVGDLNALSLGRDHTDIYFTIAYAVLDPATGAGRLCRAGHAEPMILRADGRVEVLSGQGGPPVGLVPVAGYRDLPFTLGRGDRLLLHSDGLTEAARPDGSLLEAAGLARHLAACGAHPTGALLPALIARVARETGPAFEDDVSALLVERPVEG